MSDKTSIALFRVLRPALALLIVFWLASRLDWETLTASLRQIHLGWLVAGLAAMFLETLARCANWYQVLMAIGVRLPSRARLVQKYFIANFAGSLIPSSIGTDALRALFSRQLAGGRISRHAFAVVATNLISFACGLFLIMVSVLWLAAADNPMRILPIVLTGAAALLLLLLLVLLLALPLRVTARVTRLMPVAHSVRRRAIRLLARLGRDMHRLRSGWVSISLGVVLALVLQSIAYAVIGHSAGVQMSAAAWLMLPTLVALVGMLPASFLGFGATQAAVAGILVAFGNPEPPAIVAATMVSLLALIVRVSGGLFAVATEQWAAHPGSDTP